MQRKGLLAYLILCVSAPAQPPYFSSIKPNVEVREISMNQGSAALWQSLKKLQTRASLVMVTAHPDDEDGGNGGGFCGLGRGARIEVDAHLGSEIRSSPGDA